MLRGEHHLKPVRGAKPDDLVPWPLQCQCWRNGTSGDHCPLFSLFSPALACHQHMCLIFSFMCDLDAQPPGRLRWNAACFAVNQAMADHVKAFVTPISKVLADDYGELVGTGSYIEILNAPYIITNEHVAQVLNQCSIAHQFSGSDNVMRCLNPMVARTAPVDVAIARIEDRVWRSCDHRAALIPLGRFAARHSPVEGELLFMAGYSGTRSTFLFNTLVSRGTPYLTQEIPISPDYGIPEYHFAIHYLPDRAISPAQRPEGLPAPPGFSGSLVWNTRFVERKQAGLDWNPGQADVTGLIWGWPSAGGCLVATKVEHLGLLDLASTQPTPQA
jgi:hypothetical protein